MGHGTYGNHLTRGSYYKLIKRPPKSTLSLRSNHTTGITFLATWNLTKTLPTRTTSTSRINFLVVVLQCAHRKVSIGGDFVVPSLA
jgi:hypothetical protein